MPLDQKRNYPRGLAEAWIAEKHITSRHEWIPKFKVILSYAYNGGDSLPHQVIGRPIVTEKNSVVTQTYMVAGVFDDFQRAENFCDYLKTRFVRFLIRQRKISQHNRPDTFAFVPHLDMGMKWTDRLLYEKFRISDKEQQYIESVVKLFTDAADLADEE